MSSEFTPDQTQEMLWKMIKNKSKFQVFNMFEMYNRLSLTELAEKLHKSKSTIHSHLKFLLKLGLIVKSRVPLKSNPNVFENYYELAENYEEIYQKNLNFDFPPFRDLTKEEIKVLIEPAISVIKMLLSYFETQIEYYEAIRASGFDDEAVKTFNKALIWVKDKDDKDYLLSRSMNSFNFYNESEFFKQAQKDFQIESYDNVDFDNLEFLQKSKDSAVMHKPLLIIKATLQYGHVIEYLNKQKKKSYHTSEK